MRRSYHTIIIYTLISILLLSGCDGTLFSSRRDMERLRPVQVIGLDRDGQAVTVSISTGVGPEDAPPLIMKASGASIESAVSRLQDYSPEDELTYAHTRYLLVGESMGIMPLLDWVERSPAMRMDTPLFIVRGSAAELVTGSGGDASFIATRLASLEREEASRGQHIYTLREVASSLLERDSTLCLTVKALPPDGTIYTDEAYSDAVLPSGYAVLRGDSVVAWLTQSETYGSSLLAGSINGSHVLVAGNALELLSSSTDISGIWAGNTELSGIQIDCELRAGILEREENGVFDPALLEAALADEAQAWLKDAVDLSQRLSCDYLDLRSAVCSTAPRRALVPDWAAGFSSLPVTIRVDGRIVRSYDLAD